MTLVGYVSEEHIRDIRTLSPEEVRSAKEEVLRLWCEHGMDTKDIEAIVRLHEAWCHRVITRWNDEQLAAGLCTECEK